MRCHICNATLSPAEIQWNKDHDDWDPCITCIEVIDEVFNDDLETEINEQLVFEFGDDGNGQMESEDPGLDVLQADD